MTGRNVKSREDGCEVALKCLNCPLPECRYDDPMAFQAWKRASDGKIALELWEGGSSSTEIGKELGITPKVVLKLAQEERDRLATNSLTIY